MPAYLSCGDGDDKVVVVGVIVVVVVVVGVKAVVVVMMVVGDVVVCHIHVRYFRFTAVQGQIFEIKVNEWV